MMKLEKDENIDKSVCFEAESELTDRHENEEDTSDTILSECSLDSDDSFELTVYNDDDEEESKAVQEDEEKSKTDLMYIGSIILIIVLIILLFFALKWLIDTGLDNDVVESTVWESEPATTVTSNDTSANESTELVLEKMILLLKNLIRFLLPFCMITTIINFVIKYIKRQ